MNASLDDIGGRAQPRCGGAGHGAREHDVGHGQHSVVLVDELLLQRGVQREINGGKRNVAQETRAGSLVEAGDSELFADVERAHARPLFQVLQRRLALHLQPDLHNFQRVSKQHLAEAGRATSNNFEPEVNT